MPPSEFASEVYNAATAGVSYYRAYAGTQTPLINMPESERVTFIYIPRNLSY